MMTWNKALLLVVAITLLFGVGSAVPVAGAISGITSNNATIAIAGASGETFLWFGPDSGHPIWKTENASAPSSLTIWGAPVMGGKKYYAVACDATGCGNEVSFTTSAITPIPTHGFDVPFNGMVMSHWSLITIGSYLIVAYTTAIPQGVFFGLLIGFIIIGYWFQVRSTRLISILLMILGPLIMYPNVGLYMGMPGVMQALGAVLFAIGIAGVALSLVKK